MSGSFIDDLSDIPGLNNLNARSSSTGINFLNAQVDDLEEREPKIDTRPTFPCESCAGTGFYRGVRVHQEKSQCFACKGRGFFYQSYGDRMKSRQKAAAKKQSILSDKQADFDQQYPGLIDGLRKLIEWNGFARSLVEQYDAKGSLSDKQAVAGLGQIEKAAARDAARAAEKESRKVAVDASNIKALFDKALASGIQKPGLWFGDIKLSLAGASSANAGAIYVKKGDSYQGKITGGKFLPVYGADASIGELLLTVAGNPAEELRRIGKTTNRCCCCGRTLTDPVSVANGIGPICAENWGV
jgi:hypothetical protein